VERSHRKLGDEAFLFGILHDIGKVILINNDLENMELVYQRVVNDGLSQSEAEDEIFGFNHQRLGAALLKEWKFPDTIVAGIKMHHDLPPDTKKFSQEAAQLLRAVGIANQMAKTLNLGTSTDMKRQAIPSGMWNFFGIKRADLPALGAEMRENYGKILTTWNEFD
jgi:HD-like signal output (HDOD) protein